MGPPAQPPRRNIPENVLELLRAAECVATPRRTDAICVVLGWSDDGLAELSRMLIELRRKVIWDGRAHAVGSTHPWKGTGITIACGYRDRNAIRATLLSAIRSQRTAVGSPGWAGFGLDLAAPYEPMVVYYE